MERMKYGVTAAALLSIAGAGLLSSQPAPARIEGRGASVRVPAGWKCNDRLLAAGGPISCTNFTEPYASGGVLPPNGAEIEITSVPRPVTLDSYAREELKGVSNLKLQEAPTAGRSAMRATYTDEVAPAISTSNTVFYVVQGSRLYKFYLTYRTGNARERELIQTLETMVREAGLK
jgi:hypothetical protein